MTLTRRARSSRRTGTMNGIRRVAPEGSKAVRAKMRWYGALLTPAPHATSTRTSTSRFAPGFSRLTMSGANPRGPCCSVPGGCRSERASMTGRTGRQGGGEGGVTGCAAPDYAPLSCSGASISTMTDLWACGRDFLRVTSNRTPKVPKKHNAPRRNPAAWAAPAMPSAGARAPPAR